MLQEQAGLEQDAVSTIFRRVFPTKERVHQRIRQKYPELTQQNFLRLEHALIDFSKASFIPMDSRYLLAADIEACIATDPQADPCMPQVSQEYTEEAICSCSWLQLMQPYCQCSP